MPTRKDKYEGVNINRIKAVLVEKNKNSEDLRAHFGVAQSTVSNWVTNKAQPDIYTFCDIAKFLEVDIRDLFYPTK